MVGAVIFVEYFGFFFDDGLVDGVFLDRLVWFCRIGVLGAELRPRFFVDVLRED